jgi:hypothetical protein
MDRVGCMIWRLAIALVVATVTSLGPIVSPNLEAAGIKTVITVEPFEGHTGDLIYLSGYGEPPSSRLQITMWCPSPADPSGDTLRLRN